MIRWPCPPLSLRSLGAPMKSALLLSLLALAACAGTTAAPACRGEVFQLNPTRMVPPAPLAAAPVVAPAGSVVR